MAKANRIRLDQLLITRGLVSDLKEAQALIMAGEVLISETVADKAGALVDPEIKLRVKTNSAYVSRGGDKLAAAIKHFEIDLNSVVAIDVGASTGGFTDCLLQAGAAKVYAVDVGTNQLDWKLRSDLRVVSFEQCNARNLKVLLPKFDPKPSFATVDVSFISLSLILPELMQILTSDSLIMALVKPHFELPSDQIEPGGIVTDPSLQRQAWTKIYNLLVELGCEVRPVFESPVLGKKGGNKEFFLVAQKR